MRIIKKRGVGIYSKKAQLTIFIIVALVIIALIVLFFAVSRTGIIKIPTIFGGEEIDFKSQLIKCVEENENINNKIALIALQGGSLNPRNYIFYNGTRVDYLCYSNEFFKPCVMQTPLLLQNVEAEIKKAAKSEVSNCINAVKKDLEGQGYSVSLGQSDLEVSIIPKTIIYQIKSPITLQKTDIIKKYDSFEIKKQSELYQMIMISTSILNYEARYGEADILTYMIYYPSIRVNREKRDDGSTIYQLSGRNTNEKFIFAVRSFAWPAGYSVK